MILTHRRVYKLGELVEVRPQNRDELFYPARIIARRHFPKFARFPSCWTYDVVYPEDGSVERGIWARNVVPKRRRRVYGGEDDGLYVHDGFIVLSHPNPEYSNSWPRLGRVRLLSFRGSPGVYQSGMLLKPHTDPAEADFTRCPFVFNQAMLLGIPLFYLLSGAEFDAEVKLAFLGCGGGVLPSVARDALSRSGAPPETSEIHVVDFSASVLRAAQTYFMMPKSIIVHPPQDALVFAERTTERFHVAVCDCADPDDVELPPDSFWSPAFLSSSCFQNVFVMNILSLTEDRYKESVRRFMKVFPPGSAWGLVLDGNAVLFGLREASPGDGSALTATLLTWFESRGHAFVSGVEDVLDGLKSGRLALVRAEDMRF